MRTGERHHKLDENGVGKCAVPMWLNGLPYGFCDKPAYGPQEESQRRYGRYRTSDGAWMPGYCNGLACYAHGGPAAPEEEAREALLYGKALRKSSKAAVIDRITDILKSEAQ